MWREAKCLADRPYKFRVCRSRQRTSSLPLDFRDTFRAMTFRNAIRFGLTATAMAALLSYAAIASESEETAQCYDAVVSARIVRQTPSVMPDCDGCWMMVWPWFLELDVRRVEEGQASRGLQLTLALQHTYFRTDLGIQRWWLRRNSLGGFNVLRLGNEDKPRRCADGSAPAAPYLRPGPGKTLQDFLREGQQRYGDEPHEP